jgi:hypothetical protein
VREAAATLVAFAGGVVGATAGAAVMPRVVGAVLFVVGMYLVVDALVLGASWRLTDDAMKIPTVASRHRQIAGGSGLVVAPGGNWFGSIHVTGEQGTRTLRVNPLVSPTDLRRWFATIADDRPAR